MGSVGFRAETESPWSAQTRLAEQRLVRGLWSEAARILGLSIRQRNDKLVIGHTYMNGAMTRIVTLTDRSSHSIRSWFDNREIVNSHDLNRRNLFHRKVRNNFNLIVIVMDDQHFLNTNAVSMSFPVLGLKGKNHACFDLNRMV